jgi:hypothetical protein
MQSAAYMCGEGTIRVTTWTRRSVGWGSGLRGSSVSVNWLLGGAA